MFLDAMKEAILFGAFIVGGPFVLWAIFCMISEAVKRWRRL